MTARDLVEADLRALRGEMADTDRRLDELAREIRALDPRLNPGADAEPSRATVALIAVDLHSYYTAIESLLERILTTLEGSAPRGRSDLHVELIRRAMRPIDTIRPAILKPDRIDAIDELRRFRHFFRHAYALDLRYAKMRRALDPFVQLHMEIREDLASFTAFIDGLIAEITELENH